ncbi:MAG: ATP-binding protein, partial [Pirellulales bacterium]
LFLCSLLSIVLAAVGVYTSVVLARAAVEHQAACRCLELLARTEDEVLRNSTTLAQLNGVPAASPWHAVYAQLRQRLKDHSERLSEGEMMRAGLELKSRRFQDKLEGIEQILSGLADPVVACDEYGELIVANRAAEQLLGFNMPTAQTRILRELTDCTPVLELIDDAKRRRSAGQRVGEFELGDADGRKRWYRVTAVSMLAQDAETPDMGGSRVVAFFRDISVEKDIQKRNAEFVSAVSHEMKTPLAGIRAYVELLADGDAEDEQTREEFLGVITGQADRLQRLVDNLLNIARIEAGVVAVSKESQSLNDILDEAFHLVQPSAEAKQIELASDLSPMYLSVRVDRDLILQAAINLLSNAVKYTPSGKTVVLRSRVDGLDVWFEVEDTGVGLSEEDQHKVFEKFYRVQKNKEMAAGTGLGLPLAKHIVEDVHGGRLTVRSVAGQGSTFRIQLPAAAKVSTAVGAGA